MLELDRLLRLIYDRSIDQPRRTAWQPNTCSRGTPLVGPLSSISWILTRTTQGVESIWGTGLDSGKASLWDSFFVSDAKLRGHSDIPANPPYYHDLPEWKNEGVDLLVARMIGYTHD